jgi:hypothetical protein
MNDSEANNRDATIEYARCIAREQAARQVLQANAPGSIGRAHAWAAWVDAVARTNSSLRRLNSERAVRRTGTGGERPQGHA